MADIKKEHYTQHLKGGGGYGEDITKGALGNVSFQLDERKGGNRDHKTTSITAGKITVEAGRASTHEAVLVNGKEVHSKELHDMVVKAVANVVAPDADGKARLSHTEADDLGKVAAFAKRMVDKEKGR
jgi:hypothetical protein